MMEQPKIFDIDIAWLAGMIESEGSISFQVGSRTNGNLLIVPFVRFTNSDPSIIDEVLRISAGLGASGTHVTRKTVTRNLYSNKAIVNIRIERMDKVSLLLEAIYPYMKSSKRHNADVVLQYIDIRKENLLTRDDWTGQITRSRYSKEEVQLVASIRTHFRAMPLDRMLSAPNVERGAT